MEHEARDVVLYWGLAWGTFVRSSHRLVLELGESSFSVQGGGEEQKTQRMVLLPLHTYSVWGRGEDDGVARGV